FSAVTDAARTRAMACHGGGWKGPFMQRVTSLPSHCNHPARRALLHVRARHHRFNPTPSEARLWYFLSGSKLGVPFKRQAVTGDAIVDFIARSCSLVVEVDGDSYHGRRQSADASRDRKLVQAGYTVVRIPASLIEHDLPAAIVLILRALG